MAKHYKTYNADNKNKSQNIIKKHLCLHGITRPQVAFLNHNMFAANHHDKIAPPPTPLRAPHHHRQELPNAHLHEHNDTLFTKNPPALTTSHKNETTNHNNTPPQPHSTHTTTKKTPKRPSHTKKSTKNGGNPPFFNNKPPIAPTFAPYFWLFLRDYLQFLKFSSNVHRPVLRYFLYLFPVHFHYSGRPLSVLFLNNN